jgi:hypothetical protein
LLAIPIALLVTALSIVVVPGSANAYARLGCKWSTKSVKYYVASPLASYSVWRNAASRWAGVDATLTYSSSSPHFYATNENRGNTVVWTGVTRVKGTVESNPCPSGSGNFATGKVEVVINWSYAYSTTQRQGVGAHEIGHALGLAHETTVSGGGPDTSGVPIALMYPYDNLRFQYGIYSPKSDDKAGVNAIY